MRVCFADCSAVALSEQEACRADMYTDVIYNSKSLWVIRGLEGRASYQHSVGLYALILTCRIHYIYINKYVAGTFYLVPSLDLFSLTET